MPKITPRVAAYLLADLLLLTICFIHVPSVVERPRAPFKAVWGEPGIVVEQLTEAEACGSLQVGDELLGWNGMPVTIPEVLEFYGDLGTIGDTVSLIVIRDGSPAELSVELVPFYPTLRFIIISVFACIVLWGIGLVILLRGPPSLSASVLHWNMVSFAVTILLTWGRIDPSSLFSAMGRSIWVITYMGVTSLLFFFSLVYPGRTKKPLWIWSAITFIPALTLVGIVIYHHLRAMLYTSGEEYRLFQRAFDVFQASLLVYTAGSVTNFVLSFRRATTTEERKRLQWIIWGVLLGAVPFLFAYILPQIFFSQYLIPEEYATIFFIATAASFTISFLRYRLLDIDLLINRSIVYLTLTVFVFVAYGIVVLLAMSAVGEIQAIEDYLVISAGTLLIAMLFIPLRSRVQRIVDETLYAARSHYSRALREAGGLLRGALSPKDLLEQLVASLAGLLPVRMAAVYSAEGLSLSLRASRGANAQSRIRLPEECLPALRASRILALPSALKLRRPDSDLAHEKFLMEAGVSVCIPLVSEARELHGVLLLALRSNRDRFSEEETDLAVTLSAEAAEALDRLLLQQQVFREQEEKRRSEELSRLKSYFVSSVSHEFRMPLTAIRMFAETLRSRRTRSGREWREYLHIIEGESERLTRLIENVLDFAKIERGVKDYSFRRVDPLSIARRSMLAMRYPARKMQAKLSARLPRRTPAVEADPDALEELIINLLSNALKYSGRTRDIRLTLRAHTRHIAIEVRDRGIGIPRTALPHLFEPFYRVKDKASAQVGGAGLGLSLVKHIVDAHHGRIRIRSAVGKGTTVVVEIPLRQPQKARAA